ncbi:hypothetical protein, partial [Pseudomonas knackmussii]|uniref:hypothetical protein n=1 Tax=Pseudomonas knackmussii TaxID=65741 RepID=UPI003F49DE75
QLFFIPRPDTSRPSLQYPGIIAPSWYSLSHSLSSCRFLFFVVVLRAVHVAARRFAGMRRPVPAARASAGIDVKGGRAEP